MMVPWSGCTQLSKDSKIPAVGRDIKLFALVFFFQ
jgi:hypothetical protein